MDKKLLALIVIVWMTILSASAQEIYLRTGTKILPRETAAAIISANASFHYDAGMGGIEVSIHNSEVVPTLLLGYSTSSESWNFSVPARATYKSSSQTFLVGLGIIGEYKIIGPIGMFGSIDLNFSTYGPVQKEWSIKLGVNVRIELWGEQFGGEQFWGFYITITLKMGDSLRLPFLLSKTYQTTNSKLIISRLFL